MSVNLNDLPEAAQELHRAILEFKPVRVALDEILQAYDVTEEAVKARFQSGYGITVEEHAARFAKDNTTDGYIRRFKEAHSGFHTSRVKHIGAKFIMLADNKLTGKTEKLHYRFLMEYGLKILVLNELTHAQGEIYDSEIIDDVAKQIGWKRWAHWPDVGPQPSELFVEGKPT